jgi:hypothetical protein
MSLLTKLVLDKLEHLKVQLALKTAQDILQDITGVRKKVLKIQITVRQAAVKAFKTVAKLPDPANKT